MVITPRYQYGVSPHLLHPYITQRNLRLVDSDNHHQQDEDKEEARIHKFPTSK
jgi:hypothetical protein